MARAAHGGSHALLLLAVLCVAREPVRPGPAPRDGPQHQRPPVRRRRVAAPAPAAPVRPRRRARRRPLTGAALHAGCGPGPTSPAAGRPCVAVADAGGRRLGRAGEQPRRAQHPGAHHDADPRKHHAVAEHDRRSALAAPEHARQARRAPRYPGLRRRLLDRGVACAAWRHGQVAPCILPLCCTAGVRVAGQAGRGPVVASSHARIRACCAATGRIKSTRSRGDACSPTARARRSCRLLRRLVRCEWPRTRLARWNKAAVALHRTCARTRCRNTWRGWGRG